MHHRPYQGRKVWLLNGLQRVANEESRYSGESWIKTYALRIYMKVQIIPKFRVVSYFLDRKLPLEIAEL